MFHELAQEHEDGKVRVLVLPVLQAGVRVAGKAAVRAFIVGHGEPELLEVVGIGRGGLPGADCTAGNKSAINTAMIAMTTRSSISVKPARAARVASP